MNTIISEIKLGKFEYNVDFIGCITSCCASESEDGMFYSVYLRADDDYDDEDEEVRPYANHSLRVGEYILNCHEYVDSQRKWFVNKEEIDYSLPVELYDLLQNIIKPFDFEQYAIDNFDGDAISESIPYGDPYCLIIDNCVFMIEKDGDKFTEEDVRELLESYNWSKERIDSSIEEGYEITSDVYDAMCNLPVIYTGEED